jgi:ABC-type Mn2+/Zn2+ transport system ATPase subunit
MLKTCTFHNKVYRFYDSAPRSTANVFTVIVGKNGTGKSTLLKKVVESFLPSELQDSHRKEGSGVECVRTSVWDLSGKLR